MYRIRVPVTLKKRYGNLEIQPPTRKSQFVERNLLASRNDRRWPLASIMGNRNFITPTGAGHHRERTERGSPVFFSCASADSAPSVPHGCGPSAPRGKDQPGFTRYPVLLIPQPAHLVLKRIPAPPDHPSALIHAFVGAENSGGENADALSTARRPEGARQQRRFTPWCGHGGGIAAVS